MKKLNLIIYGLLGAIAIIYGAVNLISPRVIVKEAATSFSLSHTLREQAALAIFIGLMFFWCAFNYERRRFVHYCLILFAFLLAAIHWWDFIAGHLSWTSPLYNSVPFIVLITMAVFSSSLSNDKRRPDPEVPYPPPGDLLSAKQVEKLDLEIENLRIAREWENVAQFMPIIATLIGVLGFFFTVFVFASQQRADQEKERRSRDAEQIVRLQGQIRSDIAEILSFTGDQRPATSRIVFLLKDIRTTLNTKLSDGQTIDDESHRYRRSLTEALKALVISDCDFNKPGNVALANAVAENWDDYSAYLKEDPDLNSLDHIFFKYIEALKGFRSAYPGYLQGLKPDDKGGYLALPKYDNQKDEVARYRYFVDLRDGIVFHLKILGTGAINKRAQEVKTTCLEEFEGLVCNSIVAKDSLGADFGSRPCDY